MTMARRGVRGARSTRENPVESRDRSYQWKDCIGSGLELTALGLEPHALRLKSNALWPTRQALRLFQCLRNRLSRKTAPKQLIEQSAPARRRIVDGLALPLDEALDRVCVFVGRNLVERFAHDVARKSACFELALDPQLSTSLEPAGGAHVREGRTSIIQRPIIDETLDGRFDVIAGETTVDQSSRQLGAAQFAPAEQDESSRIGRAARGRLTSCDQRWLPLPGARGSRPGSASCDGPV